MSVQKRATLTRQMSVSLSDVKNSFLILEKTESLSPIQYLFLETAFRVKRDKGSHPSRFPSCLSVFSPAISTGMEKTQTLFISKLHGHIIKWKKAIFSVPSKSKNILLYHLIVRQVSLTGEKKPIALSDENYLQPQVVRWCCWWKDWRPPITVPEPSGRIVIQITLHFLLHFQQLKTSYLSCCICHTMLGLGKNW